MTLISYFDNAGGLREGAPVRLQGVDIGNVTKIMVVADPTRQLAPVQVTMKVIHQVSQEHSQRFRHHALDRRSAGRDLYRHRQLGCQGTGSAKKAT